MCSSTLLLPTQRGPNRRGLQLVATPVDGRDDDVLEGHQEVVEAVLCLPIPVILPVRVGRPFGGDPSTSPGDEASEAAEPSGLPELLIVAVAGHKQVEAETVVHVHPEILLGSAREVCYGHLPLRRRLREQRGQPARLLAPQVPEPLVARVDIEGATRTGAGGAPRVMLIAADVVARLLPLVLAILVVGVQNVDVHPEVPYLEIHLEGVVRRRQDPTVALPRVGKLLIPAVVEAATSPVVVAQAADPWNAVDSRTIVNALEDLVELVRRGVRELVHRVSASLLDTSPVEVVAHIQNGHWVVLLCSLLECLRNQLLRRRVNVLVKATARRTAPRPPGLVAVEELLMIAHHEVVLLVPASPGEGRGAWLWQSIPPPGHQRVTALYRLQHGVHATPVADGEDVVWRRRSDLD
mmetsp:Transcript_149069/g.211828  ORF Transcript_149069/g.211828 Transcript_149069/m.211828 type:complete len:409 (-) Transcript_149069:601-1827(-)